MDYQIRRADDPTRRAFVSGAAKAFLGLGTLPLVGNVLHAQQEQAATQKSAGGTAQSVIYLFMSGGMSHLDTFDTKPGAETQGPLESIATSANGVSISEYFPLTAKQMHHVAIINSLNSNQGAHAQGQYYMHTAYAMRGTIKHPDLGAWTSYFLGKRNPTLPPNVKIGGNSSGLGGGFLETKHAALPIGNPEEGLKHATLARGLEQARFDRRLARAKEMNREFLRKYNEKQVRAYAGMYDEAIRLMKSRDLDTFDLTKESDATRERYGRTPFGQACLLARRLVENNVRFIEIDNGGWDTHTDNFDRLNTKCDELDSALSALLGELEEKGLLENTMVVLSTEFGRTPTIVSSANNGRNHYPQAFSCLMAGGGINGGIKYGKTDDEGREIVEDRVDVTDFNATIAYALGLPLETDVISPSKRPFTVADKGQPVKELFS